MSIVIKNPDIDLLREIMRKYECNCEEAKVILERMRNNNNLKAWLK